MWAFRRYYPRPEDPIRPETVTLTWDVPWAIRAVQVLFDSALHFHFWQRWQGYAVNAIPTLVKDYRLVAALAEGTEVNVADVRNNYQRGAMRRLTSPSHFCYNVFMVAGGTGTLGASMRIVSSTRGNNTRA